MDFSFTNKQQGFRKELSDFCISEPYGEIDPEIDLGFLPHFFRRLAAKGWLGLSIPRKYGGLGYGKTEECIFHEELGFHKAPMAQIGANVVQV